MVGHPRSDSFSHALAGAAEAQLLSAGWQVRRHDLYVDGFDPILRADETATLGEASLRVADADTTDVVARYRADITTASALVVAHPNWWGKPPAMMAGWIDRVLIPGVAYRFDETTGAPISLTPLRSLLVFNTSDTTPERETAVFGDPLERIWRACVGEYLGQPRYERLVCHRTSQSDDAQRAAWLERARLLAATVHG